MAEIKDYLNFEGLSRFLNNLTNKFSAIGHTHTITEVTDLKEMVVSDDGNGNVTFENAIFLADARISNLEQDVATMKITLEDNDILVADNA